MYTTTLGKLGAACTPQYLDYQCVSCCEPAPVSTATPTAPVAQNPRTVCNNLFQMWIGQNPQYNACMTRDDRDQIVNQCIAWQTNRTTLEAAEAKRIEILERACGATFNTACEKAYAAWVAGNPELAKCASSRDKKKLIAVCVQSKRENWSATKLRDAWNAKVNEVVKCPVPTTTPPAAPTVAPTAAPPPAPPPAPTPYVEPPAVIMPEQMPIDGGDPLSYEPQPEPQPSAFRVWGPVIGVGALIAAGAYYLSRKPKPKRRAA